MTSYTKTGAVALQRRRSRAQFLVCMVLVTSMELAGAQVAGPCSTGNAVASAAAGAAGAARARVLADQDAHKQVLTNAMSCLQRIKDMLAMLTIPAFPDITAISMSRIIDFLSNKACQVVVAQVQTAVDPVINTLGGTQAQIDALAGTVNGVSNQIGGGNVLTRGAGSGQGGPGGVSIQPMQQQVPSQAQPQAQSQGSSVWSRVGCTFSFGSNCP